MPSTAATSARACSTVAPGASRAIISVMRCVRPSTISALRWCALITMLSSASTRSGKYGAGWTTPITVTDLPSSRTCLPTMLESPPKRFIQNSCVSTITGGTPGPSSLGRVSLPSTARVP